MEYGLLLLRLVVGLLFAGHGAQKLFGWFGGAGTPAEPPPSSPGSATAGPRRSRSLSGSPSSGEELLLASGFLTPLASFLLVTVMLNAIATVVWPRDSWAAISSS